MNKLTSKYFSNELEKISSVGVIGDVLAASLLSSIAMTGLQHGKGFIEAKKAGAKWKDVLRAHPLPLGPEWKYSKVRNGSKKLNIPTSQIPTPYKGAKPYVFHMEKQNNMAKAVGMPVGVVYNKAMQARKEKLKEMALQNE